MAMEGLPWVDVIGYAGRRVGGKPPAAATGEFRSVTKRHIMKYKYVFAVDIVRGLKG